MTDFPALRLRIARHTMEGRTLASELRSYVEAEERRAEELMTRSLALTAADRDDEAEAVNDEANAIEERMTTLRSLRDTLNDAEAEVRGWIDELDACGEDRTAHAPH